MSLLVPNKFISAKYKNKFWTLLIFFVANFSWSSFFYLLLTLEIFSQPSSETTGGFPRKTCWKLKQLRRNHASKVVDAEKGELNKNRLFVLRGPTKPTPNWDAFTFASIKLPISSRIHKTVRIFCFLLLRRKLTGGWAY